jgi:hypothetical protein
MGRAMAVHLSSEGASLVLGYAAVGRRGGRAGGAAPARRGREGGRLG